MLAKQKKFAFNLYSKLEEFIDDVEQVFKNCRIYNGSESIVGQIGVRVYNEYLSLIKTFNLQERFIEAAAFQLDANMLEAAENGADFVEELSESELPQDSIRQMNERQEQTLDSGNPEFAENGEANN